MHYILQLLTIALILSSQSISTDPGLPRHNFLSAKVEGENILPHIELQLNDYEYLVNCIFESNQKRLSNQPADAHPFLQNAYTTYSLLSPAPLFLAHRDMEPLPSKINTIARRAIYLIAASTENAATKKDLIKTLIEVIKTL